MGTHRSRGHIEGAFRLTDRTEVPTAGAARESSARRRLYGRSKGKALRRHQVELLEQLLPQLTLDFAAPVQTPADLFRTPVRDVWLEIGFGGGEHLIEAATKHPDVGFIGCEPFVNGMAKLLSRIDALGLTNVRLHQGDAGEVIDWLPGESLGRVFLLYPDPWPKRRHRKRRFVSAENLGSLARVMRGGAELRLATDIDDYAGWALARIRESADFSWSAESAESWLAPWDGWTRTRYEEKAVAAGRSPIYLTFVRKMT